MLNISYCVNNTYSMQLCVSIVSLLENNIDEKITIHVLSSDLSNENKAIIKHCVEKYKQLIFFYNILECLDKIRETVLNQSQSSGAEAYWNAMGLEAYARFFIVDVVPKSISKIVYLDCDTIICNSIRNIFSYGDEKIIAATLDYWPANYMESIGCKSEDKYFNAGVQLINLDLWRKENISGRYMDYISTMKKPWRCYDQDIMNVVLANQIETLPLEYNMMYAPRHFKIQELYKISKKNENNYYSKGELQRAKDNIVIIHFAGELMEKPWRCTYADVYSKQWNRFFQMSPYAKMGLQKCMNISWGRYLLKLFKHFCEYVFLTIIGRKGRFHIVQNRTKKYVNRAIEYNEK